MKSNLLIHIPHSSTKLPYFFWKNTILYKKEIQKENIFISDFLVHKFIPKKNYKVLTFKDVDNDYVKDMVTGEEGKTGLPKSNVLYYQLENNAWCCVRPSGTEPKIKLYFGVKGKDENDATESLENLKDAMVKLVKGN